MEASPKLTTQHRKPFFRRDPLTTILWTGAIFFGSQVAAVILVSTIPSFQGWTEAESFEWLSNSTGAQFLVMLLVTLFASSAVYYLIKHARILPARIGAIKPKWRDLGYAAVAYVLYFITYFIFIIIATQLLSGLDTDQAQDIGFENIGGSLGMAMAFLSLVILPPIWEETVFRGFLFSSLRAKMRLRFAVILTSLAFGAAHLELGNGGPLVWVAAIDTFILSCVLCLLREKTGSLWSPILLHTGKNFIAFYLLFIAAS